MTDPISDMFTRILNAYRAGKESVIIPHSKFKLEIVKVLKEKGFIKDIEKKGKKVRKFLELTLRYQDKAPAMVGATRVSKSSRRVYVKKDDTRILRQTRAAFILSTSKGVMTSDEAKKQGMGGEIIAKVW